MQRNPLLSALFVLMYELLLVILGFALTILRDLRSRWIGRLTDAFDAWLQRRLSRYTRSYLRYVQAANKYVDLKGLTTRGEHTLGLHDVFVHLSLDPNSLHTLSANPVQYRREGNGKEPRSVWYWLRRAQHESSALAIIGPPGSGKTTLLRHVASVLAQGGRYAWTHDAPRKIPILINLRTHKDWAPETSPSLPALIRTSLKALNKKEPPSWVESNLAQGHFAILLDGLDEIADATARASLTAWIDEQQEAQPDNLFAVTSRPFGYQDNPLTGATVVQVRPFTPEQVATFINRWYVATSIRSHGTDDSAARLDGKQGADDLLSRLERMPALLELSANPLLLTMIANVHYYRGALPASRAELYKETCEVFLGKRHQARGVILDMPATQKQLVLQELAYAMMSNLIRDVPLTEAANYIRNPLSRVAPDVSPEIFLRRVEESSGLLLERERGVYAFAHLTFQEYLSSVHIRDNLLVDELAKQVDSVWWRETIRLYAANADATPIIKSCLAKADDVALLVLAGGVCRRSTRGLPRSAATG
jgi:predicted NACHT family NTPase